MRRLDGIHTFGVVLLNERVRRIGFLGLLVAMIVGMAVSGTLPNLTKGETGAASGDRLWSSGAELNSTTADLEVTNTSGTMSISSSTKRSGDYAYRANPSSSTGTFYKTWANSAQSNKFWFRTYLRIATAASADTYVFQIGNGSSGKISVQLTSSSTLKLRNEEDNNDIGSASSALSTNTWYRVEVFIDTTTLSSTDAELRLDGVSVASTTNENLAAGVDRLTWGVITSTTADLYFDDIAINNSTGRGDNWPGDGKIVHMQPDADGDNTAWIGDPSDTNDYDDVDEVTPNGDTDFIRSQTNNQLDDVNMESSSNAGITANDYIKLVSVGVRIKPCGTATGGPACTTAGTDINYKTRIKASGGGTTEESASTGIVDSVSTYSTNNDDSAQLNALVIYDLPGSSTTAWTTADLDAAQIGVRNSDTGTIGFRVTAIWLQVEYTPKSGGRIFSSGFELNSVSSGVEWTGTAGTAPTITTSPVRSGTYALKTAGSGLQSRIDYTFAAANKDGPFYARFYMYIITTNAQELTIFELRDSGGSRRARFTLGSTRVLRLYDEDGQIGSDSYALQTGTWYRVEMKFDRTAAAGSHALDALIDGTSFASATNRDVSTGITALWLGNNTGGSIGTAGQLAYDDVALNDGGGATQATWPGSGRIIHLKPNAVGDNSGWTTNGTCTGGNYACSNEVTPNDATNYVSTGTTNTIDDYGIDDSPLSTADTISLVQVGVRFSTSSATQEDLRVRLKDAASGVPIESDLLSPASTTWVTNQTANPRKSPLTAYTRPEQSTSWTDSTLDTAQIGIRDISGSGTAQVSTMWLLVEYVPPTNSSLNIAGFETGDALEGSITGTGSVQSTTKRGGQYSLKINPTTTATGYFTLLGLNSDGSSAYFNSDTTYIRFYFSYITKPASSGEDMLAIRQPNGSTKALLRFKSTGAIEIRKAGGTLLGTTSTTLSASTWYRIEVKVATGASSAYEVKINGSSEISGTDDMNSAPTGQILFGKAADTAGNTVEWYYDDVSVSSSAYPGAGKIELLQPDGNGNYTAWTGSYTDVDEVPHDTDTTYISSSTAGDNETETLESAANAGIGGSAINMVKPGAIIRDEGGTSAMGLRLRSGSYDIDTAAYDPGSTYLLQSYLYKNDPSDGNAWTTSDLDSLEVGATNTVAVASRVTSVFVEVDFTGYDISGTIYQTNESSVLDCSSGGARTVRVKVNGNGSDISTTCVVSGGTYTLPDVPMVAGDPLTVYLDGATEKAATFSVSAGAAISGYDLYQDRATTRCDNSCSLTNANINKWDKDNDSDIHIAIPLFAPLTATINNDWKLLVKANTYAPGYATTTVNGGSNSYSGDLEIKSGATLDMNGNSLNVGGSFTNSGTYTSGTNTTTLTSTDATETLKSNGSNFSTLAIDNGIVTYYKFDEGTGTSTVTDSSGDGLTGTMHNFPGSPWTTGVNSTYYGADPGSLIFDGSNDRININETNGINTTTTFTVSMWIYPVASSDNYAALVGQNAGDVGLYYRGNLRKLSFYYSGADHLSNTAMTEGQWNHIAMVVNAGSVTFYLNGSSDGTASSAPSFNAYALGDDNASQTFNGRMDEFRLYSRALGSSEITSLNGGTHPTVATFTLQDALSTSSNLYVRTGKLDSSSSNYNTTVLGNYINVAGFDGRTATFTMNAGSSKTLQSDPSFKHLTFTGSAPSVTFTIDKQRLDVDGDLTISSSTTFDVSASSCNGGLSCNITAGSSWSNSGVYTARTGLVTFDATATGKTLSGTMTGSSKFNNLTFNGSGGAWSFGSNNAEVGSDLIITTGTLTASSGTLTITGNYTNNATFTHNSGTVTFNATSTGKTLTGTLTGSTGQFSNLTFNGSGGGWSNSSAMTVVADLTMTDGTLSGTNDITVNGNVAGTSGAINLTGGTFEQRASASKNFGATSGSATWTFNSLTFSNSSGSAITYTTQTGGTGTITVNSVLIVGKAGDSARSNLDAGNRTWTIGGTAGNPLQVDNDGNTSRITGNTSTFAFSGTNGGGNTTVEKNTNGLYNHVTIGPTAGLNSDTYVLEGATTVGGNLTINVPGSGTNTLDAVSGQNYGLTIGGNYTNNSAFTARNGTVTFNATSTGKTLSGTLNGSSAFYDLTFNGSGGGWSNSSALLATHDITMTAGELSGTNNVTVNGSVAGTAGSFNFNGGTFLQTISASKNFGTTSGSTAWTFYDLSFTSSGSGGETITTQTGGSGYINVTHVLTLNTGGACPSESVNLNAGNRDWNLSGTTGTPFAYNSCGTFTGSTSTVRYTGNNGGGNTTINNAATYNNLETNDGLVGYWALDDGLGTNAADYSGYGSAGTLPAGGAQPTWSTTVNNSNYYGGDTGSLSFDAGDYVTLSSTNNFASGTTARSMCAWAKSNTTGAGSRWITSYGTAGTSQAMSIGMSGTTLVGSGYSDDITSASFWDTNWHHICLTYDGTNARLYGDGSLLTGPTAKTWNLVKADAYIGAKVGNSEKWDGLIDDVRIFNRALSSTEISNLNTGTHTSLETYVEAAATTANGSVGVRSGTYDVTGSNYGLTIGSNYTNVGVFTARSGTVTFNATATGKTLTGLLSSASGFYNLTFNGSGGEWTPSAKVDVSNDLTVTAGSLLGTKNIAVSGGDATGNGTINLTGGTFTLTGSGNFGGTSAWTFSDLTFGASGGGASTATATGAGGVTVSGTLTLTGRVSGTNTLNAGSKTWTLSGTSGAPFGGCSLSPGIAMNADTSTFAYTGNNGGGNTSVNSQFTYYSLTVNNGSETYVQCGSITTNNNLTITTGTLDATASNYNLTVKGDWTNNGTFTARSGTVTFSGTGSQTIDGTLDGSSAFYNLTLTNSSGVDDPGCGTSFTPGIIFVPATTVTNNYTITTASVRVRYSKNTTYTFNNINWNGQASGTKIFFRSNVFGVKWNMTVSGTQTGVSYVNTMDSDASGGNTINAANGTNTDCTGNTNWSFFNPNNPASLAQKKTDDTVIATGGWTNETSVKFTANISDGDNPATIRLCVEKDLLGTSFSNTEDACGSTVNYTGSAVAASVTISSLTDTAEYHWQARVKDSGGAYSSWVSYDSNLETDRDFGIDTTACSPVSTVYDGTVEDTDAAFNDGSLTALSANWDAPSCSVSGLKNYDYSIGTTVGGTDIKAWTNNSTNDTVTSTSLDLRTNQRYYINVRVIDNANNTSSTTTSNGQDVLPTLTFSLGATTLTFANLNDNNSRSDTKTLVLTTSTNAYGGYVIRQYAKGLLTGGVTTIPMFEGGTYASPGSWPGGFCTSGSSCGYGYTSDDTTIQGSNKFSSGTLYAAFSLTAFGDIVADHTANVTGGSGSVSGEQFTITHKVAVDALQNAKAYQAEVVYVATGTF